ncbi:MAG TPA: 30S ribosomal protein S16 [Candidatus Babeliales bacterium]|nr:30S ribosomal protein S16 [Candidatus Babeliales bacterium]
MAVRIRLSRIGTKNRPFYRIIATDARSKRDGEVLANVGTFDPVNGSVIQFHEDIYQAWLAQGAIATDSAKKIYRLYKKSGTSAAAAPVQVSADEAVKAEKAEQTA